MKKIDTYLDQIQRVNEGVGEVVFVATGFALLKKALNKARSIFKSIANERILNKYCGNRKGYEKLECKSKIKEKAWLAEKAEIKKWAAQCSETNDARKCLKRFQAALDRIDNLIMKERERMSKKAIKYTK